MNNIKKSNFILLKNTLPCPVCGSKIVQFFKGYCCSNSQCTFLIPKEIRQKAITQDIVKKLIQQGKTDIIHGFHKKGSSQTFSAQLFLTQRKKIKIELPDISYLNCPKCSSEMVFFERGIRCSKEHKCDFILWNHFAGKRLTRDQMIKLISVKKTDIISGFISKKNGKKFSARIVLNNKGKFELEFN